MLSEKRYTIFSDPAIDGSVVVRHEVVKEETFPSQEYAEEILAAREESERSKAAWLAPAGAIGLIGLGLLTQEITINDARLHKELAQVAGALYLAGAALWATEALDGIRNSNVIRRIREEIRERGPFNEEVVTPTQEEAIVNETVSTSESVADPESESVVSQTVTESQTVSEPDSTGKPLASTEKKSTRKRSTRTKTTTRRKTTKESTKEPEISVWDQHLRDQERQAELIRKIRADEGTFVPGHYCMGAECRVCRRAWDSDELIFL